MPEIRPACRDLCLRAEIRVAKTPSDDKPSHIFLSLPLDKYLPFLEPSSRYVYIIYILHLTPPCTSAGVILDSGTFSDISDVLATAKFDLCIFLKRRKAVSSARCAKTRDTALRRSEVCPRAPYQARASGCACAPPRSAPPTPQAQPTWRRDHRARNGSGRRRPCRGPAAQFAC